MVLIRKEEQKSEALPGRIITKAVGKGSPCESGRMTVGYADYCEEAGPMEPHNHAEETVYIIRSVKGYIRYGDAKDNLGARILLKAGMLIHFAPLEWHVFEYDKGGRVEIIFIYGQVDHIRPEEIESNCKE
jgi:hypothetical protein